MGNMNDPWLDYRHMADEETDRLAKECRQQVFNDICFDSAQWELMEAAILETIKTGDGSHVCDCFMAACRDKASKAVRDPNSYYYKRED